MTRLITCVTPSLFSQKDFPVWQGFPQVVLTFVQVVGLVAQQAESRSFTLIVRYSGVTDSVTSGASLGGLLRADALTNGGGPALLKGPYHGVSRER